MHGRITFLLKIYFRKVFKLESILNGPLDFLVWVITTPKRITRTGTARVEQRIGIGNFLLWLHGEGQQSFGFLSTLNQEEEMINI